MTRRPCGCVLLDDLPLRLCREGRQLFADYLIAVDVASPNVAEWWPRWAAYERHLAGEAA